VHDIRSFIKAIRKIVASHNLGEPGAYRRWNWQNADSTCDLSLNPYGCADVANILYMIGDFPRDPRERECWIRTLRGQQNSDTGLLRERKPEIKNHEIHSTAFCIAALELFDACKRGPKERADMLQGLGIRSLAYDWRDEHIGTFDEELAQLRAHDVCLLAFYLIGGVPEDEDRARENPGNPARWSRSPSAWNPRTSGSCTISITGMNIWTPCPRCFRPCCPT